MDTQSGDWTPPAPTRLRPWLFVALRATHPLEGSARHSIDGIDDVTIGRGTPSAEQGRDRAVRRLRLRFDDPRMSTEHARLQRCAGGFRLVDTGSKNGSWVNRERITADTLLRDGDLIELGATFFVFRTLRSEIDDDELEATGALPRGCATMRPDLAHRFALLARAATTELPILVFGETGTGKELVARAVHQLSGRRGSFVAVNCGALPATLVEAELFGSKKGAFSGATADRPGLIRASDGGTLFLDEVGELPWAAQAALLRVLQEREVLPVGATQPAPVDLRVVCATHRRLDQMAAAGDFRADLLARINGFSLQLPPLRERREDFGLLVAALARREPNGPPLRFMTAAARELLAQAWPTNIRGLQHCLVAAAVVADGEPIDVRHLEQALGQPLAAPAARADAAPAPPPVRMSDADQARRGELVALLSEHDHNISAVARVLGKSRFQIRRWIKRYELDGKRSRAR